MFARHFNYTALAWAAAIVSAGASLSLAADGVRVVQNDLVILSQNPAALAAKLITVVESATVNSTDYAAAEPAWGQVVASRSYIHATYSPVRKIRLAGGPRSQRETRVLREILFALPKDGWPTHLYVRSESGQAIAVTKYDAAAMGRFLDAASLPKPSVGRFAPMRSTPPLA